MEIKKNKCKSKTIKGNKCNNFAMKNSDYCYMHSFGKFRNAPFLKNSTVHFIVAILLTLFSIFISINYSASKKEIKEISEDVLEVKSIVERMEEIEKTDYEKLIKKYPDGYVLFAYDHKEFYSSGEDRLLEDFEIKWDQFKISYIYEDRIGILLPDIYAKSSGFSSINFTIDIERNIGDPFCFCSFKDGIMCIELLEDDDRGFIFLFSIIID